MAKKSNTATKLVKKIARIDKKIAKHERRFDRIHAKHAAAHEALVEPITFIERDAVDARFHSKLDKRTKKLSKAHEKRAKVGAKLLAEHDINIALPQAHGRTADSVVLAEGATA